jgi:hypothetical protein
MLKTICRKDGRWPGFGYSFLSHLPGGPMPRQHRCKLAGQARMRRPPRSRGWPPGTAPACPPGALKKFPFSVRIVLLVRFGGCKVHPAAGRPSPPRCASSAHPHPRPAPRRSIGSRPGPATTASSRPGVPALRRSRPGAGRVRPPFGTVPAATRTTTRNTGKARPRRPRPGGDLTGFRRPGGLPMREGPPLQQAAGACPPHAAAGAAGPFFPRGRTFLSACGADYVGTWGASCRPPGGPADRERLPGWSSRLAGG